jgi:hypothetical protein
MSEVILVLSTRWPLVRRVRDPKTLLVASDAVKSPKHWVVLPDGRVGYVEHHKADGNAGIRPVDRDTGEDLPNPAAHWSDAQRRAIPEEVALPMSAVRDATPEELPHVLRNR